MTIKKNSLYIFTIFLISHLVVWSLIPTFSNINLPLDTIEALAWGSNLDWGYSKHPPLSAFSVELIHKIFGSQDWIYYLFSQINIIIAFIFVWKFSQEIFDDKIYSLFSVLILESIYFYNFTSPEFNVNISQLPFFALTIYYFWKGINKNKLSHWFLFGLFSSLGFLSKYFFSYLLLTLLIYLILNYQSHKKIFLNYLISLIISLLIVSPHLKWLIENEFITVLYGFNRTGLISSSFPELTEQLNNSNSIFKDNLDNININFKNHLINPVIFIFKQFIILIPFFLISISLLKKLKVKIDLKNKKLFFLLFINFFPILLIILTAIITGAKIRTMWMTPFYLFLGVLIIHLFKKNIDNKNFKKFFVIFLFYFLLSPITYLTISLADNTKRTDYPGKEISRLVQNKWDENFRNEIKIVIGDEWSAGNLSYHLNSRPKWTQSLKNSISSVGVNEGVIYTGNPQVLKKVCPGVFGVIRPVGYCMIGQK